MAIDGAVRLNRFGLERGRLWSALAMLVAVFAPLLLWAQWDELVSGEEELRAGSKVVLTATPPPMTPPAEATIELTIPSKGWITDIGTGKPDQQTFVNYPVQLAVTAVAGVENLDVLFERQQRDLADAATALFTTSARPYTTPSGLIGLWGDLTGESYSGALIVVGSGTVAAILVVTAPLGRLDSEMDDIAKMLATLEVAS